MKLIWNGHSCFTLATEAGTLVIDPYEDGSVPGLSPLHLEADAVYCSHEHRDHGNRAAVALSGKPCAVEVEELATWHDEVQGAKRGPNTMRIFSAEGLRVAHLGDLGCGLTPEQAETMVGHAVGGVCPFCVKEGVKVYLDPSLRRFDIVYPACGSPNSAVKLTPEELELLSGGEWCDLCKLPEPAAE